MKGRAFLVSRMNSKRDKKTTDLLWEAVKKSQSFEEFVRVLVLMVGLGQAEEELQKLIGRYFDLGVSMDSLYRVATAKEKFKVLQATETKENMEYKLLTNDNNPFDKEKHPDLHEAAEFGADLFILANTEEGDGFSFHSFFEDAVEDMRKYAEQLWKNYNKE